MPYYDEVFKHVTGEFPYALAALALNTSEVEVGDRLSTDQATVRMHHSDMTFHVRLPDEEAILHIEAQPDDAPSLGRPRDPGNIVICALAFREFSTPTGTFSETYIGGHHARISFLRTRHATRYPTRY